MRYITTEELDKEVNKPLVNYIQMDSIKKFIETNRQRRADQQVTTTRIEPLRPITTKAFIYEEPTTFKT